FNSDWYDMEIGDNSFSIFVITGISIAFGGVIMLILAANIRSRFNNLSKELTVLSEDVDALTEEITSRNDYQESLDAKQDTDDEKKSEATDEIEMLGLKIRSMHKELNSYLAFVKDKANTDALTLVNNTTAYTERQKELESKIADGSACFSLAIFDINNLKSVNDQYGHHCGDLIIKAAADSLSAVFEAQDVFRIGGDEFIVIVEGINKEQLEEKIGEVNKKIDEYNNSQKECEATLAVSVGVTQFDPDNDKQLRDAFNRADDLMYANKKEYYRDLSHDRRKR
ncbi:MAG: GGDEF domain-containing protein, partial [Erysipelotrichaceae bacterium]|nr:GGDEF domain-containing protein [Erysipelotrichaceae bacterium]